MPEAPALTWDLPGWEVRPESIRALREAAAAGRPRFPEAALRPGVLELEGAFRATPVAGGTPAPSPPSLTVRSAPASGGHVLLARLPSGALRIVRPEAGARRATRFFLPLPEALSRRSPASSAVRFFLLRAAAPLVDRGLPRLAAAWEEARFLDRGQPPGLVRVTASALDADRPLPAVTSVPPAPARSLLLLHGLFSDTAQCFRDLATTRGSSGRTLLAALEPVYGDRVFGFDHATVSRSPEENARDLLAALPEGGALCDVVTHSRGGVVLRTALETGLPGAGRLVPGRVVLTAAPNLGSPLADPGAWEEHVGWLANLLELFPAGPFRFALDLVSEALLWIAGRAAGALPGIAALAPGSATLRALEHGTVPPDRYLALAASCHPEGSLALRLADAGADRFFGGANDLVVPTEGGWHLASGRPLPGDRAGCFGPGGNLPSRTAVHHLNLLSRPAAIDFLERALLGRPAEIPVLDTAAPLPSRAPRPGKRRGAAGRRGVSAAPASPTRARSPRPTRQRSGEPFQLTLLPSGPGQAQVLATWGAARVVEPLLTRGGDAGDRMRRIIARHEEILAALSGRPGRTLPGGEELVAYGSLLFETLFPGDVRRLFDAARAGTRGRLDLVFTSAVDWLADKPWEFAWDPVHRAFLALEDVHFVRNVFSAIPAETVDPRKGPLSILVASSGPAALPALASREERSELTAAFSRLVRGGLARIETVTTATPEALHRRLASDRWDVLHFIGHGVYDARERTGALVFEDGRGGGRTVEAEALRQLLGRRGLKLVFLNACESGRGGRTDFTRGVAPALVACGLPAVVANQYSVLDTAATRFAAQLYWSLARGHALGDAAREARVAVSLATGPAALDWAVPVLYARDPRARLVSTRPGGGARG